MADNKKVANSVVVLSSAAVLAVYGAGYARTRAAADRFSQQAAERRPQFRAPQPARAASDATRNTNAPAPLTPEPAAPAAPGTAPAEPATPTVKEQVASDLNKGDSPGPPPAPLPAKIAAATQPAITPPAAAVPAAAAATTPGSNAAPAAAASAAPPAQAAPFAPVAPVVATEAATGYKDGTYYGWGSCRHGDIQAAVVIQEGKIIEARVERCETRYSCNWVTPIQPRIVLKQGTTYDYVSGATESSDAFQDAVAEALFQAK